MAVLEVSRQVKRRVALAAELPTEHPEGLDDIETMIAGLPDPDLMCAEQRAGALTKVAQLRNQLDAYMTEVAAAADDQADSRVLQVGTTGMLVAVASRQNPQTGSVCVHRGNTLRAMPHLRSSFGKGAVSAAHVAVVTAEAAHIRDFAEIEPYVVAVAEAVEPAELRRLMKVLADQSRPEKLDHDHEKNRDRRGLSLTETPNGMFRLDGYLDAIAGATLRDELARLMGRSGREDPRTAKQRRADALAELVSAGAANRSPSGVSEISVLVDLEDLSSGDGAQLEDGSPLGSRLYDLITCSSIVSVILGTRRKNVFVPLALARGKRGASASQWKALIVRDRGCIRCGRSPRFCHAHHVHHWRHGGATDVRNMVLLCSRCHHDLHFGQFDVVMEEGIPRVVDSGGRAPPLSA